MSAAFLIISVLTIASAVAAVTLRNLVHCALALTVTFAGLAAFYLQLNAQFVGFAQLLVYVGAVAILIVFAILLTREGEAPQQPILSQGWLGGVLIAAVVFVVLGITVLKSSATQAKAVPAPAATVRAIGDQLMNRYVLPLEVIGLLLTAALIGAVIIALQEKEEQ